MTLDELIAVMAKADGPSRALDWQIEKIINPLAAACTNYTGTYPWGEMAGNEIPVARWEDGSTLVFRLPKYTDSIDAAMTLLPEGVSVHIINHGTDHWGVTLRAVWNDDLEWGADHANLPIAICIASLRAR